MLLVPAQRFVLTIFFTSVTVHADSGVSRLGKKALIVAQSDYSGRAACRQGCNGDGACRPLVDWLDNNGYSVVTKTTGFSDGIGRRKNKLGVELAVNAMDIGGMFAAKPRLKFRQIARCKSTDRSSKLIAARMQSSGCSYASVNRQS